MAYEEKENRNLYEEIGIIFISPIIGLPASLISTFDLFRKQGIDVEGVDIWENQNTKKNLWKILGLTILPGKNKRLTKFANNYNEEHLFEIISKKVDELKARGRKRIILGGMSGGFIFAARMAHIPLDSEIAPYAKKIQPYIKGLFGISPLVFYPSDILRKGANLELIPSHIPTMLIWGDADTIIPKGTIKHSQKIIENNDHIKHLIIHGSDLGLRNGSIKHQFFGGKDFIKPLGNNFWNPKAETLAMSHLFGFIKNIAYEKSEKQQ